MRDSGQRKLTYSSQNHCTSSRSVYLSRRLNSHWERFVITHHLQKWESQLRLRWICFWATPASKNFALYQFGSTKNAVLTKLSIQHFLFIWYIPSKLHTEPVSFHHYSISHFWSSPQTISNSQLHVLPHFHLCPIYLVVFKGVYFLTNGISHLKGGFTLRCLQRLSLPGLATRP